MRKIVWKALLVLLAAVLYLLSGCGDTGARPAPSANGGAVDAVLQEQIGQAEKTPGATTVTPEPSPFPTPAASPAAAQAAEAERVAEEPAAADKVDIDLTAMSGTMVYGEVNNMIAAPEDYIGKAVKIAGEYCAAYFEPTKQHYHFVVISDATACCSQDMEFVWAGEHAYPDDYPKNGTKIEIAGVFETYEELGYTYCHLIADEIKVVR